MAQEIEILGPNYLMRPVGGTDLVPLRSDCGVPVQPGTMIPSGRWWVCLPGNGVGRVTLNGQIYEWPKGMWFVLENKYFNVLKETDLPMVWLDGFEMWEKTIDPMKRIGERHVNGGKDKSAPKDKFGRLPNRYRP
jgi:hypothetical protein